MVRKLKWVLVILGLPFLMGCDVGGLDGFLEDSTIPSDIGGDDEVSEEVHSPKTIVYPQEDLEIAGGGSLAAQTPFVTGGEPTTFEISPDLPTGLVLNSSSGVISGTAPSGTMPPTVYTVTSTNSAGSANFTITISIAAGFTVNDTANYGDASVGDGLCVAVTSGTCTLRAAIEEAQWQVANTGATDYLVQVPNGFYDISGDTQFNISESITVSGQDREKTVISGGGSRRIFAFTGGDSRIKNLSLVNANSSQDGGAVNMNNSSVTFTNVKFFNNTTGLGSDHDGGAIFTTGSTGGPHTFKMVNCVFERNSGDDGGAFRITGHYDVDIEGTYFDGNYANTSAAAVYATHTGTLDMKDSSFFRHSDAVFGVFKMTAASVTANIDNVTMFHNSGTNFGAMLIYSGTANIKNSTFVFNSSDTGAGGIDQNSSTINLTNNIIAFNTGAKGQCNSTTSLGYNLVYPAEADCGTHGNDLAAADPRIQIGYSRQGSDIPVIALLPGSPAIDTGSDTACLNEDARGQSRPVDVTDAANGGDGSCDVGAFEYSGNSENVYLHYGKSWEVAMLNQPLLHGNLTPTVSGTDVNFYSISPPLPAGMTINPNTGVISGTPTELMQEANYMVTASTENADFRFPLKLKVLDGYVVDSTEDLSDDNGLGNGCFASGATGPSKCTLRAAIEEAENDSDEKLVFIPDNTYNLTLGSLDISSDITVSGQSQSGTILDFQNNSKGLNITGGHSHHSHYTIQQASTSASHGSAVDIANAEGYFTNMSWLNNTVTTQDASVLYANGALSIVEIEYSLVKDNQSVSGGDDTIWVSTIAYASILNSTLDNNTVAGVAGGIGFNVDLSMIAGNTFKGNSSGGDNSATYTYAAYGAMIMNNSYENNDSNGGTHKSYSDGYTYLVNNSFKDNTLTSANEGAAFEIEGSHNIYLYNNIFQNNQDTGGIDHCADSSTGDVVSYGFNIMDGTDADCSFNGALGDVDSASPNLQALSTPSVGPVDIMELLSGSPAIEAASGSCPLTDATQSARSLPDFATSGYCDLGAWDF